MGAENWMAKAEAFFTGSPHGLAVHGAVAVLGLGPFGYSLARELTRIGVDVIGLDRDEQVVDGADGTLSFVARGDATDPEVLTQLGLNEASKIVVAIGSQIETSILTVSRVRKVCPAAVIWAKAGSEAHAEILEQMGVDRIIRPEVDLGVRLAHLVRSRVGDFMPIDEGLAIARTTPPAPAVGRSLGELQLRRRHSITVIAVRRPGGRWQPTDVETVLDAEDEILVLGESDAVDAFAGQGGR